ncbi:MAG: rRNA maturation RNase YbeY [Myxococcaceae bacterium]
MKRNAVDLQVRHPSARRHAPWLQRTARAFLRKLKLQGVELSLTVVDDAEIRALNREWRKKDKTTDVLSFPAGELPLGVPGPKPLGDIVISFDTTRVNAKAFDRTVPDELRRYLAHGLLHLLGHDHHRKADAAKMSAAERLLLGEGGMLDG